MSKKIITLQFGPYANFTGHYLWNIQDKLLSSWKDEQWYNITSSLDLSTLHKTFTDICDSISYLPRTLIFGPDTDNTMIVTSNFLPKIPTTESENMFHYESTPGKIIMSEKYLIIQTINNNGFESKKVYFSHKSFDEGIAFGKKSDAKEKYEESIRLYSEECDQLQGFFSLIDVTSGYSGMACEVMEHLDAEYNKTPILTTGLRNPAVDLTNIFTSRKAQISAINEIMLTTRVLQFASLHIPLECLKASRMDTIHWDFENENHTSATLASLIDSVLLPISMIKGKSISHATSMTRLCSDVIGDGSAGRLAYVTATTESIEKNAENQLGKAATFLRQINYFDKDIVSSCSLQRVHNKLESRVDNTFSAVNTYSRLSKTLPVDRAKYLKWSSIIPIPMQIPDSYPRILSPVDSTISELSLSVELSASKSMRNLFYEYRKTLHRLRYSGYCASISETGDYTLLMDEVLDNLHSFI